MTTREQIEQHRDAITAWLEGRPVESSHDSGKTWRLQRFLEGRDFMSGEVFRPARVPKTRLWNCMEDVVLDAWMKSNTDNSPRRILSVNKEGIVTHKGFTSWNGLGAYAYSLTPADPASFRPCVVECKEGN